MGVTLLINVVALSAILFRLASDGFTPNRVTVLGANLVIMGHLAWLGWTYVGFVRQRVELGAMRRVVGSYLPMYVAWAAVVVFVAALAGIGMLVATAEHGGRLVFRHGLGVATVPSSGGQLWTMPDHLP